MSVTSAQLTNGEWSRSDYLFEFGWMSLAVPRQAAWQYTLNDVLGFQAVEGGTNGSTLFVGPGTGHHVELREIPDTPAQVTALGFSTVDRQAFETLVKQTGAQILSGSATGQPNKQSLVDVAERVALLPVDIGGAEVLIYDGAPHVLEVQPPVYQLLHPLGTAPVLDDTIRFMTESCGLRVSDYMTDTVSFLRAGNRYHHALALMQGEHPPKVGHVCFLANSFDDLMIAREKVLDRADIAVCRDLVLHGPSGSIAFYFLVDGSSIEIEICTGHERFTAEEHDAHRPRRLANVPGNFNMWRAWAAGT